jgi:hypothetical protein
MNNFAARIACTLSLAALLAACGSGSQLGQADQTAATVQINVATATMPAPDCAADGCKGLRIIDANAEAYRYAAMQRGDSPQS